MHLRYKVGDKVRVRADMYDGYLDRSVDVSFVTLMKDYRDTIVTISKVLEDRRCYYIKEDSGYWLWTDSFFEDINQIFTTNNVVLLRNGQVRLVHNNALYLPDGTCIEIENYTNRKHNFDENFDIVEVHRKAAGNYLFDISGELIQEES